MMKTIKEHLNNLVGCVTFDYNGYSCGIDPLAHDDFDMWCGNSTRKAHSIEEVMKTKFFNRKALEDIVTQRHTLRRRSAANSD